jgi:GTPase SAR1 family protein
VIVSLSTFSGTWWAWEAWSLPPRGSNQLTIALAVAAAVSAAIAGPMFWWAGQDEDVRWPWEVLSPRGSDGWLEDLQRKMRSIWVEEALRRSLDAVAAIELGFVQRPDAVVVPMRRRQHDQPPKTYPKGTPILEIFESDDVERRLVLLGQPGSGKTTQLLRLSEKMLDRLRGDSDSPTPIYIPLSAGEWRDAVLGLTLKAGRSRYPPAIKWFANQVEKNYQVPKRRVLQWLSMDPSPVVLLLDGLDEIVNLEERRRCVRALSQARRVMHAGMIVACRVDDYTGLGEVLNFGSAIDILPLSPTDIDEYLKIATTNLESLREAVSKDHILTSLLDTPLMLYVAAMAYRDREVERDLLIGSMARRRDQLWQTYLSEMTKRRRNPQDEYAGNPRFPPSRTARYLEFLASAMTRRGAVEFNPSELRSKWLPAPWDSVLLSFTALRAVFVLGILNFADWLFYTSKGGIASGVLGIIFGTFSAIGGFAILLRFASYSAVNWKWSWSHAARTVFALVCCGAAVSIALILGGRTAVVFGCLWGLCAGLMLASVIGWRPIEDRSEIRKQVRVWNIFRIRIVTLWAVILAIVLWLGPIARTHHINYRSPAASIGITSCVGVALAAAFFSLELLLDHYSSQVIMVCTKMLPLRMTEFLVHADERILLRRVGVHYRFLHLTLRDHLAGIREEPQTVIISLPPNESVT